MMQASDRAALRLKIEQYTKAKTATRTDARAVLIGEGIYTETGKLAVEYGGTELPAGTARTTKR